MLTQYSYHERYYDKNPESEFATGDIWSGLPTHGLLRRSHAAGIVVTPACDLANDKVETVTYLPILPILDVLLSRPFQPMIRRKVQELLHSLDAIDAPDVSAGAVPPVSTLDQLKQDIVEFRNKCNKQKVKARAACAIVGVRYLRFLVEPDGVSVTASDLNAIFGEKLWKSVCSELVTNSYRSDVHFLPADQERREWSLLPEHSLALFRYPLTAPIEIFELARDRAVADWNSAMNKVSAHFPLASAFQVKPIKHLKLRTDFLNDLLTRFTGLFNRLGSPDFSPEAVDSLCADIGD